MNITYKVYVKTDSNNNITAVNSSAFLSDTMNNKTCKYCDHWIDCDKGFGVCECASTLEWDAFTEPDESCARFAPIEEDGNGTRNKC